MDRGATVLNCLTALDVRGAKVPVDFATDAEILDATLSTMGLRPKSEARLVWIKNTGHLTEFVCSEALMNNVQASPSLEATSDLGVLPVGQDGMLPAEVLL